MKLVNGDGLSALTTPPPINCLHAGRLRAGHTFCGPGRAGPGPHNPVCGPGPGRVCTTAAGPGRAWASNHICGPGLGLNFRPVPGPTGYYNNNNNNNNNNTFIFSNIAQHIHSDYFNQHILRCIKTFRSMPA